MQACPLAVDASALQHATSHWMHPCPLIGCILVLTCKGMQPWMQPHMQCLRCLLVLMHPMPVDASDACCVAFGARVCDSLFVTPCCFDLALLACFMERRRVFEHEGFSCGQAQRMVGTADTHSRPAIRPDYQAPQRRSLSPLPLALPLLAPLLSLACSGSPPRALVFAVALCVWKVCSQEVRDAAWQASILYSASIFNSILAYRTIIILYQKAACRVASRHDV